MPQGEAKSAYLPVFALSKLQQQTALTTTGLLKNRLEGEESLACILHASLQAPPHFLGHLAPDRHNIGSRYRIFRIGQKARQTGVIGDQE